MTDRDKPTDDIFHLSNSRDQLGTIGAATYRKPDEEEAQSDSDEALEDYLASRLQQIGDVHPEQKEIKAIKTGNGWDADQVLEHVYKIDPISLKQAVETAVKSNRTRWERFASLIKKTKQRSNLAGTPTVEFIPIWSIKGFHECYFLRNSTYRVKVRNDVVGVEVEGRGRDLMLERKHSRFIPSAIADRFQMFSSFLTSESKYFVVSEITELATKRSEAELVISSAGRPLSEEEEMMLTSWRAKRVFDASDLKVRGANVKIKEPAQAKEFALGKFREKVVSTPQRFKQILSNRLQITELKLLYAPFILVPVQKGLVPRDVIVNGTSGELAKRELLELLE